MNIVQKPGEKTLKTTPAPPVASFSQIWQKVSGISVSVRLSRTRADARWVPARAPAGRRPGSINNAPLADQIARGFRQACLDSLSSVHTERDAISLSFLHRRRPRRSLHSPAPRIHALLLHSTESNVCQTGTRGSVLQVRRLTRTTQMSMFKVPWRNSLKSCDFLTRVIHVYCPCLMGQIYLHVFF